MERRLPRFILLKSDQPGIVSEVRSRDAGVVASSVFVCQLQSSRAEGNH